MTPHRSSYKKTTFLAAAAGTLSLVLSGWLLLMQSIGIPWTGLSFVLHPALAWGSGVPLLGLALYGYAIALGGVLALQNDVKGRAHF
ncbi:protein of unknown function [Nitrospira japonica]|uniref:Uncharacterized protein n=1 Tax=Nitrospira japonica TaxID=1325564 RepID=A0A1W1IAB3_9BACT|nr:hypothetical protein [Nitrospira japonica]SLM49987.1 protein of unknown function [Nitrospira japonica]